MIDGDMLYDVEHALSMYATSFAILPAEGIYDSKILSHFSGIIQRSHVYVIGFTPDVKYVTSEQKENVIFISLKLGSENHTLKFKVSENIKLVKGDDQDYLVDEEGNKYVFNNNTLMRMLSNETNKMTFDVKYIGQAYGKDGKRNAIDRLLKHEKLQQIAVKGVPDGYQLSLLLLEVQPNTQLITMFNPFAEQEDDDNSRVKAGLDKLFETTEAEQISLYEAALIRYFYPPYNKEFKDSFPSTNLKILRDCYDKDFAAVIAEICIDDLPLQLYSEKTSPKNYHIAKFHLHNDDNRKAFFYGE